MFLRLCPYLAILFVVLSTSTHIHAEEEQSIPLPTVAYGKIVRFTNFPSKHVQSRTIDVLLPNGYSPKNTYPVLYVQDGQMLFDNSRTWNHQEWGLDETLLEHADSLESCIIVGIWNMDTLRRAEYFPEKALNYLAEDIRREFVNTELYGKALGDEYLEFLTKELKPFIQRMFSASSSANKHFLMGSSMGALISLYALCEYPDQFGGIAGLSTHWPGSLNIHHPSIPDAILHYFSTALPLSIGGKKIYLDHGTDGLDSLYATYQEHMNTLCKAVGYDDKQYKFHLEEEANHNEEAWRNRLHLPLYFLLKREQFAD